MQCVITPVAFAATNEHFCGIALNSRWCLTVSHPFAASQSCRVRFFGVEADGASIDADKVIRHDSLDLALVHLQSDAPIKVARPLFRHDSNVGMGRQVEIFVSYPSSADKLECFTHYSIGTSSSDTTEYRLGPENSKGHSGGVVSLDGQVIGILFEREKDDPHCYAIPVAAARDFIDKHAVGCVEWTCNEPDDVVQEFLRDFQSHRVRHAWLQALKPATVPDQIKRSEVLSWLEDYAKHLGDWKDLEPDGFVRESAIPALQKLLVSYVRLAVREAAVEHVLKDAGQVTVIPAEDSGLAGVAYTFGRPSGSPDGSSPRLAFRRSTDGWIKPLGVVDPSLVTAGIGPAQKHHFHKEFWLQCSALGAYPMPDNVELPEVHLKRLQAQLDVMRSVHRHITVIAVAGKSQSPTLSQVAAELGVELLQYSGEQGGLFYCAERRLRALILDCLYSIDRLQS